MKSFQEHLTESKKTYPFTVKLCGALPESVDKQMKSAMSKYVVNKLSKGKTTPIQSNPLDFPGQQNSEVHVFEVDLAYPTTSAVLTELLADKLSVSASRIRVRTLGEMAEIALNLQHNEPTKESVLDKDYEVDTSSQELVGQKRVVNFLKELGKTPAEYTQVKDANEQLLAKSAHKETAESMDEPKVGVSPLGSTQNKIPSPKGK
jgi:hypothetical protein